MALVAYLAQQCLAAGVCLAADGTAQYELDAKLPRHFMKIAAGGNHQ